MKTGMVTRFLLNAVRGALGGLAIAAIATVAPNVSLAAQKDQGKVVGERYIPGIWVDPDGCEHWVMDDGLEGYMTPRVNRQGIPVCHRVNLCGVMNSDTLFATDSARLSATGRNKLIDFFKKSQAFSYIIAGHTDSRASGEYNLDLSLRRANAVARIAKKAGARITDVRGYGERMPVAPNTTAAGMQKNRRVEIMCIR